jgi:excisionase family DNA binding protein
MTSTATAALSVEQARTSIGLSRSAFYDLIGTGELRTLKIGRRRLVRPAELERFLKSREAGESTRVSAST